MRYDLDKYSEQLGLFDFIGDIVSWIPNKLKELRENPFPSKKWEFPIQINPDILNGDSKKDDVDEKVEDTTEPDNSPPPVPTFDQWLGTQGLSRNENSANYYGSFFVKSAKDIKDLAFDTKKDTINSLNELTTDRLLGSHSNYALNSSKYSGSSEDMYEMGMQNSGFNNYLKGITYLSYRDEINKTNSDKATGIAKAENDYKETVAKADSDMNKDIADRENELRKQYLSSI